MFTNASGNLDSSEAPSEAGSPDGISKNTVHPTNKQNVGKCQSLKDFYVNILIWRIKKAKKDKQWGGGHIPVAIELEITLWRSTETAREWKKAQFAIL